MTDDSSKPSLSYKDAGVNIDAGNALVERIKGVSRRTARPEVLGGLGGFGALCEIPEGYKQTGSGIGHRWRGHQVATRYGHGHPQHHRHWTWLPCV